MIPKNKIRNLEFLIILYIHPEVIVANKKIQKNALAQLPLDVYSMGRLLKVLGLDPNVPRPSVWVPNSSY